MPVAGRDILTLHGDFPNIAARHRLTVVTKQDDLFVRDGMTDGTRCVVTGVSWSMK